MQPTPSNSPTTSRVWTSIARTSSRYVHSYSRYTPHALTGISGSHSEPAAQETRIASLELELDDQRYSRSQYQQQAKASGTTLSSLQQKLDRDAVVVVLVDGDGAKFLTELLQDGEAGGVEAAQRFKQTIRQHLGLVDRPLLSDDISIIVDIWANLDGLATSLYHDGCFPMCDPKQHMRAFAEAFSRSRAELDFINVGKGKENADSKMRKLLPFCRSFISPMRKYIFFAGCHDNGYLHDLGDKRGDEGAAQRIILVETTPAEPGFKQLGFPLVQFTNVFRSSPLVNEQKKPGLISSVHPAANPTADESAYSASALDTPRNDVPSLDVSSPVQHVVATHPGSGQGPVARGPSPGIVTSSGNGGVSISYVSAGGVDNQNVVIKPKKKEKSKTILCNINEERLDPPNNFIPLSHPSQTAYQTKVEKIKPKVLCNEHYLTGYCSRGELCPRIHDVPLTPDGKKTHLSKARTSACPSGVSCDNYDCYLSHSCPPGPSCKRGKQCKFSIHFTTKEDLKPVYRWIEGQ